MRVRVGFMMRVASGTYIFANKLNYAPTDAVLQMQNKPTFLLAKHN